MVASCGLIFEKDQHVRFQGAGGLFEGNVQSVQGDWVQLKKLNTSCAFTLGITYEVNLANVTGITRFPDKNEEEG